MHCLGVLTRRLRLFDAYETTMDRASISGFVTENDSNYLYCVFLIYSGQYSNT